MNEIMRRGRWAVDSSAKRCAKAARTLSQMQGLSIHAKRYAWECEEAIGNVLLRRRAPLAHAGVPPSRIQDCASSSTVPCVFTVLVFLEVFSGAGHFSRTGNFEHLVCPAIRWDVRMGAEYDLRRLLRDDPC